MKWRLREGQGEAIYEIGVSDNGLLTGLNQQDMEASMATLQDMANTLGATTTILRKRSIDGFKESAEILVRKVMLTTFIYKGRLALEWQ